MNINEYQKQNVLILFHAGCPDGFGAAWAAWKKFGDGAEYRALHHSNPAPDVVDREVYMLDFAYDESEKNQHIAKQAERFAIIDHHPHAEAQMAFADDGLFDVDHSGAVLAWQYFFPGEKVPELLRYVEDTDLWRHELPNSRAAMTYIEMHERTFATWEELAVTFEDEKSRKSVIETGWWLLQQKRSMVERIAKDAQEVEFAGHPAAAVNAPSILASDLGEYLYSHIAPVAIVWSVLPGEIRVSLRSDGTVNVGELAEQYGGGGHPAAAGFVIKKGDTIPWKGKNKL